jgi:hypothetical protein
MDPADRLAPVQKVTVRVHYAYDQLGGLKGTSFHTAEKEEISPRIIFLVNEVQIPQRNSVVSVARGEAWRIDRAEPVDDETVTAHALRVSKRDFETLPVLGLYVPNRNTPEIFLEITPRFSQKGLDLFAYIPASEVAAPAVGALISLGAGEAYEIAAISGVSVELSPLASDETIGLPTP